MRKIFVSPKQENDTVCYFKNVVGDNIFMVTDSPDGSKLRNIIAPFYTDKDENNGSLFQKGSLTNGYFLLKTTV